jgi:insulysin
VELTESQSFTAFSPAPRPGTEVPKDQPRPPMATKIQQSPGDTDRTYRHITLSNNLECVLISDPTTDKSSAALQVNVGHMSDPRQVPGIAHFCEHMCFQGTQTYPGPTSYKKFLSDHGGSSNASTGMVHTTYFFDITHPHLEAALLRFSKFFIEPLFDAECTDRELNAVNSENAKNVLNDRRRLFQLSKHLSNPVHSYSKFGTGNRDTLETVPKAKNLNVRELLLQFHQQYYSANVMKLCILGRESLETLEAWATHKFTAVPNTNVPVPSFDDSQPFRLGTDLRLRIDVVPVREVRWLRLDFMIPSQTLQFHQKPCSYLSHLIGHEGPGSILVCLKKLNLANGLSAGLNINLNCIGLFRISIDCTEKGIKEIDNVIEIVFTYLNMLRHSKVLQQGGAENWIYNEKKQMSNNAWLFKSKESPANYTKSIVTNMNKKGWKKHNVLIGNYFTSCDDQFDPSLVANVLNALVVDHLRIFVVHRSFSDRENNDKETWYGTEYQRNTAMDESTTWLKWKENPTLMHDMLHLPNPNPFVPSNFDIKSGSVNQDSVQPGQVLVEEESDASLPALPPSPLVISNTAASSLGLGNAIVWHLLDNEFQKPKSICRFYFYTPLAYNESPLSTVLTELYCAMITETLNEYTYDASCAGLSYSLTTTTTGLALALSGYNHKMNVLLKAVLEAMTTMTTLNEERYAAIKQKMTLRWKNFYKSVPYQWSTYNSTYLLQNHRWHISEKINAIEQDSATTASNLIAFGARLLSSIRVESLFMGNVLKEESTGMTALVVEMLGLKSENSGGDTSTLVVPRGRGVKLKGSLAPSGEAPPQANYLHRMVHPDVNQENSAVEITYQIGPLDMKSETVLHLLFHLIQAPCFATLRTTEQLGYSVWSGITTSPCGILSAWFIIQSKDYGPQHLDNRIEHFLKEYRTNTLPKYNDLPSAQEETSETKKGGSALPAAAATTPATTTFDTNVLACISKWSEKDKTLSSRARRYSSAISSHKAVHEFNARFERANELRKGITLDDVIQCFDRYIHPDSMERKKLSCHVVSPNHLSQDKTLVENNTCPVEKIGESMELMNAWKASKTLYPSIIARPTVLQESNL